VVEALNGNINVLPRRGYGDEYLRHLLTKGPLRNNCSNRSPTVAASDSEPRPSGSGHTERALLFPDGHEGAHAGDQDRILLKKTAKSAGALEFPLRTALCEKTKVESR
jgi:hypothetical protein